MAATYCLTSQSPFFTNSRTRFWSAKISVSLFCFGVIGHIGELFLMMENHQEYLSSDFGDLLAIATCVKKPKDFKIPTDMARYARDRRAKYAKTRLSQQDILHNKVVLNVKLAERLARNAEQFDKKWNQQNFYSQFYLLNGLSKLRNLKIYSTREDLFKNLTETSSKDGSF